MDDKKIHDARAMRDLSTANPRKLGFAANAVAHLAKAFIFAERNFE